MAQYRTRRTWILAEALLGYLAFIVGLSGSGLITGGRLAQKLAENGDNLVWGVAFMGIGGSMAVVALLDAFIRNRRNDQPINLLTRVRTDLHVLLFGAWTYGIWTVALLPKLPIIFLMLAPVMAGYHIWGAWEHTKARFLGDNPKYYGIYDRLSRGGFGGHDQRSARQP